MLSLHLSHPMDLSCLLWTRWLLPVVVILSHSTATGGMISDHNLLTPDAFEGHTQVLKRMENIQDHLLDITRSVGDLDKEIEDALIFDDLNRKRALFKRLSDQFKRSHRVMDDEKKRGCRVNMGFNCRTQEVDDFANWYNYLQSPNSPGRKRSVDIEHQ